MSQNNNETVTLSPEQMQAEIARLKADLAKAQNKAKTGFKVTEKGAISVYGLQRFPVTLYAPQWEALMDRLPELKAFIAENEAKLSRVNPKKAQAEAAKVEENVEVA